MKTYRLEREDGPGEELPDPRFRPRRYAYGSLGHSAVTSVQEAPVEPPSQTDSTQVREDWLQARQRRRQQEEQLHETRKQLVYPELGGVALRLDHEQ